MTFEKENANFKWQDLKNELEKIYKTESLGRKLRVQLRELKYNPNGNFDKFAHKYQEDTDLKS